MSRIQCSNTMMVGGKEAPFFSFHFQKINNVKLEERETKALKENTEIIIKTKKKTLYVLTIDFQFVTNSDLAANTWFTCPLDLHVEGVSPRHAVDGQ